MREKRDGSHRSWIEDWHAVCQAIYKGVEGEQWDYVQYKYLDTDTAVNIRTPSNNRKAKTLWMSGSTLRSGAVGDHATPDVFATSWVRACPCLSFETVEVMEGSVVFFFFFFEAWVF